jgi:hypothetical protein
MSMQVTPNYLVLYRKKYMKGQTNKQTWLISGANVPLSWKLKKCEQNMAYSPTHKNYTQFKKNLK